MLRFLFSSFLIFLFALQTTGQHFKYSDRELYLGMGKLPLVAAPGNQFHLWHIERYQTKVYEFDQELHHLDTKTFNHPVKAAFRSEFLKFHSFYYTLMSDSASEKIYRVDSSGSIVDQTELIQGKMALYKFRPYYFTKGSSNIFLVQKTENENDGNTLLSINVFDSVFNYKDAITLTVPYINGLPQNLQLHPEGDDLLLLNNTFQKGEVAFSITRIDASTHQLSTKVFNPEGLQFMDHKLFMAGDELILQSQVKENGTANSQEKFSYLMKLNSDLEVIQTLFVSAEELHNLELSGYFLAPVLVASLPGKNLLSISSGIKKAGKGRGDAEIYQFLLMDSNLNIRQSYVQPVVKGRFTPLLTILKDKSSYFFYTEESRQDANLVHKFEASATSGTDALLMLTPTYHYDLGRAVVSGPDSFVMPYYQRGKVGLVRVNL